MTAKRVFSAAVRLRTSLCVPVWQKVQVSVQPTCEETHKVPRSSSGMWTVSTSCPSAKRKSHLRVPSIEVSACDTAGSLTAMDRLNGQAFDVIFKGIVDAFDLSKEHPKTLARYDTAPLVQPDSISKKWNNHKYYRDHSQTLGRLLLLARRLCEAGVGFVTLHFGGWDMHGGIAPAMKNLGPQVDNAVAAFLEDTADRGLDQDILLVITGEFGRTPRISYDNGRPGRDHWPQAMSVLVSGGGLKMGQVIGSTNAKGEHPKDARLKVTDLWATMFRHLGIDYKNTSFLDHRGRPMPILPDGEPIAGLV